MTKDTLRTEMTPEEIAQVMAEMKAQFTADDLYGYVEGQEEQIPIEDVLAKGDELIRARWGVDASRAA
jgi:hypothetical protein